MPGLAFSHFLNYDASYLSVRFFIMLRLNSTSFESLIFLLNLILFYLDFYKVFGWFFILFQFNHKTQYIINSFLAQSSWWNSLWSLGPFCLFRPSFSIFQYNFQFLLFFILFFCSFPHRNASAFSQCPKKLSLTVQFCAKKVTNLKITPLWSLLTIFNLFSLGGQIHGSFWLFELDLFPKYTFSSTLLSIIGNLSSQLDTTNYVNWKSQKYLPLLFKLFCCKNDTLE